MPTPPNIYVTATSAFGLHRNADNADWMAGMWGPGGGPGTVWGSTRPTATSRRLRRDHARWPREYRRCARQHRLRPLEQAVLRLGSRDRHDPPPRPQTARDSAIIDHGVEGRASFVDAATGADSRCRPSLSTRRPRISGDCRKGDFTRTPSCWNFADFRRRVWGLGVRRDTASGEVRLYYAVWSSQGFGNPDFAAAGEDEKRN